MNETMTEQLGCASEMRCTLTPDWVVQSSPGRWHAYWKVTDCQLDEFASLQSNLTLTPNGDRAVKDLPLGEVGLVVAPGGAASS